MTRFWAEAAEARTSPKQTAPISGNKRGDAVRLTKRYAKWDKAKSDLCCYRVENVAEPGITR